MLNEKRLRVTMEGFMATIVENYSPSAQDAAQNGLSAEFVDRRERKYLRHASKPFLILSVKWRSFSCMAYTTGDVLVKINDVIVAEDKIRNTFRQLVSEEAQSKFDLYVESCKDRKNVFAPLLNV
jgi:hypothetical protein